MARPKQIPVYTEGPQAADNFLRTMSKVLSARRPTVITEHTTVTDQVTVETKTLPKKKPRARRT